jgi:N-methylhydantoinase A/acetophenone carboxylase
MRFTIDIDTGGTFTDGFTTCDGKTIQVKVDTTPHDLTVCFLDCINETARMFEIPVTDMLRQTDVLRFSSTIGSNTLIQRSGPKLGLIVTKGFENSLYGREGEKSPALGFLVADNMVVGIEEEVDSEGSQVKEPDEADVRAAIHSLLENGARAIVISLRRSSLNASNERKVKQIVRKDYPRHYIGAVSVLIATDVSSTHDDAAATNIALLNAYFHPDMVRFLYKAEDDVRKLGFAKPLLIAHFDGGVARVAKTTAVKTYGSGPAAGICGTACMSRLYNLPYVVSLDIGGTSTDFGITVDGNLIYNRNPLIETIPIKLPMIDLQSIAGGGGSVAKVTGTSIRLGPESVGGAPGPACYDLGGTKATPTDACVVLGYIDPDYFLGGKKKLKAARSKEVIERHIARPLGISVEEAAYLLIRELENMAAASLSSFISARGYEAKHFALFSFGGGGGLYSSAIADIAGIRQVYAFPFSSVFSAYGSSTMDISHTYESSDIIVLSVNGNSDGQIEEFNRVVARIQRDAIKDMKGEGFPEEKLSFFLEMEVSSGDVSAVIDSPSFLLQKKEHVKGLLDNFFKKTGARVSQVTVQLFRLRAVSSIPHPALPSFETAGEDAQKAVKSQRDVYWKDGFAKTDIYESKLLSCGNTVHGPALIESETTTIRIPPGKRYTVDKFRVGIVE